MPPPRGAPTRAATRRRTAWLGILAMALVSQLLGHTALNAALRDFTPSTIALTTLLEPVIAGLLAAAAVRGIVDCPGDRRRRARLDGNRGSRCAGRPAQRSRDVRHVTQDGERTPLTSRAMGSRNALFRVSPFSPVRARRCRPDDGRRRVPTLRPLRGFLAADMPAERQAEKTVLASPSEDAALRDETALASEVHRMGSPADYRTALYVRDALAKAGWNANIVTYTVPIAVPTQQFLQLLDPSPYTLNLYEPEVPGDSYSRAHAAIGMPYSGYSNDGDVTGSARVRELRAPAKISRRSRNSASTFAGPSSCSRRQGCADRESLGKRQARCGGDADLCRPDGRRILQRRSVSRRTLAPDRRIAAQHADVHKRSRAIRRRSAFRSLARRTNRSRRSHYPRSPRCRSRETSHSD